MSHLSELLRMRPAVLNLLPPDETVASAVQCMSERRVGAVLLVEQDRLLGIFSERDLLRRVMAAGRDPAATSLREVMTRDPLTATADESVSRAIAKMRVLGCRHLPILEGDHVVDTLSIRDLLFRELEERDGELAELRRYLHGEEPGGSGSTGGGAEGGPAAGQPGHGPS